LTYLKKYIKLFRIKESLQITGFFIIGYFFAAESIDSVNFFHFLTGSYLLVFSFYAFNSYAGYQDDLSNKRLGDVSFISKKIFLLISILALILSLILFSEHEYLFSSVIIIFFLGYFYSVNGGAKYIPFLGTSVHFIVEIFQFNIAFIFVHGTVTFESFFISLYFGTLFSAGHIHHELIDFESDKNAGIKTIPAVIGLGNANYLCFLLFFLSFLYLLLLFKLNYITTIALLPFSLAFTTHLIIWIYLEKTKGVINFLKLHRTIYRTLYFLAGILFLTLKYN
jgi:4-hydroxybenzoate polyprenyltransferase